jgi:hypothetical protein
VSAPSIDHDTDHNFPGYGDRIEDAFDDSIDPADVIDAERFGTLTLVPSSTLPVQESAVGRRPYSDPDDRIEDAFDVGIDPADAIDAEAFGMLTRVPPSTLLGQESVIERRPSSDLDDPGQPAIRIDGEQSRAAPTVIIDQFPFGSPGAPITGPDEGSSPNESSPDAPEEPMWAPFHSQRDWEVAYWAKMRGLTSSAVTDLLAIPEVRGALPVFTYRDH